MKYCKKCGNQLSEHAEFCNNCGKPVGGEESLKSIPQQIISKIQMTKKNKIIFALIAAVIVILLGIHSLAGSLTSKDRLIEKFETAVLENDAKEVASLLTTNNKKMEINEDSVQGLMKYFKENPDEAQDVIDGLKKQSAFIDQSANGNERTDNSLNALVDDLFGFNLVSLQKDGKFLIYDKYKLSIPSVYLIIETNYKNTVLTVDGKEVGTADTDNFSATYGPYLPGYHTVNASLKTDYFDLQNKKEVLINGSDSKKNINVFLEADNVTFYLPDAENSEGSAKLYINGKDVGVNLYEQSTFGPVLTDGSMTYYIEAEMPWGTVKTEEKPIENFSMHIDYLNEELKTTLMDTAFAYVQEWATAYTTADISKMKTASKEYKEAILKDALAAKEDKYVFKGEYLGTDFALDSFLLEYNEESGWEARVSLEEKWNRDTFYAGWDYKLREKTDPKIYYFTFDEKENKWLVNKVSSLWWGINDNNKKEYKVESAKEYESEWINDVKE